MLNCQHLVISFALCSAVSALAAPPVISQTMIQVSEQGEITVKPEGLSQFNFNNQTGIAEGHPKSRWYSQYRLEVKKKNGKIEKIFEMFPAASISADAPFKGESSRVYSITNQQFKDGNLDEVLYCGQTETRSTYLLGAIDSPLKKMELDCYMASRPMCEKMRNSIRRLSNDQSPKSLNELAAKIKDCQHNVMGDAVIAMQEIDRAIASSSRFTTMLDESKAEIAKKYKTSGFSLGKPEINIKHGNQAYLNMLDGAGQIFHTLNTYVELCQRFLPGEAGSLVDPSNDPKAKAVSR